MGRAQRLPRRNPEVLLVILVYCAQAEVPRCVEVVADLRAQSQNATVVSVRHYDGEVESTFGKSAVTRVLFTARASAVEKPYQKAGIAVECLDERPEPEPVPVPPPIEILNIEPEPVDPRPWLPDGYQVSKDGRWWKAFGPDGRKVGRGKASEAKAREEAWRYHDAEDPWHEAALDREQSGGYND